MGATCPLTDGVPFGSEVIPKTVPVDKHSALVEDLEEEQRRLALDATQGGDIDVRPKGALETRREPHAVAWFLIAQSDHDVDIGLVRVIAPG